MPKYKDRYEGTLHLFGEFDKNESLSPAGIEGLRYEAVA